MKSHHSSAFSLTELLVSLAVVSLIAAIIIPRYLNLQSQAQETVAQQMASEINSVYADWKGSGGIVTGTPNGSLLLYVLSGQGGTIASPGITDGSGTVTDSGLSSSIRINLPDGTPAIDPTSPSNGVPIGSDPYLAVYSQDSFAVVPAKSLTWQQIGTTTINVSSQLADITDPLPTGSMPSKFLSYDSPHVYTPYKSMGAPPPPAVWRLPPYALSYNGVYFGILTKISVSGSLYGTDGTSCYRADYTQTYLSPDLGSTKSTNSSLHYAGAKSPTGYTPYRSMGLSVVSGASWSVTFYKGVTSN